MKKLYYSAFTYLIVALMSGVAWREITKILDVQSNTALGKVHTHLFTLGFMIFLILVVFEKLFSITYDSKFSTFFVFYHIGVSITAICMFVRGLTSILVQKGNFQVSDRLDASISGMSGMGHMAIMVALIILMLILKKPILKDTESS